MHDHSECKFRIPVSPGVGMKCPERVFYITTIIVRHSTRTSRSLSTGLSTLGREAVERVAGREVVVRAAAKVVQATVVVI